MTTPLSVAQEALGSFLEILRENRRGKVRGVYSVCSAHPLIIDAALARAAADHEIVCIESTSNQVDQFGGYTGMKPADFAGWIFELARARGLARDRVLLGGDHLGPNAWRDKHADEAMALAEDLVRHYVTAGYLKIHLDCSMPLGGDVVVPGQPLADEVVAARAARLCRVAEAASREVGSLPIYIIGTEVPVPGGATVHEDHVPCTSTEAAETTISSTRKVFEREGVGQVWDRVVGVVVQPGVEFGDDFVFDFHPAEAEELSQAILKHSGMVWEAHSTDYQTAENLRALVRGHFAILKVGPWLTFALREGIYSLLGIEDALVAAGRLTSTSGLGATIDKVMSENPKWWKNYYLTDVELKKRYSYSDRIRYYWGDERIAAGLDALFANLDRVGIPESLLGQFFPDAFPLVRARKLSATPGDLIRFKVDKVLRVYAHACGQLAEGERWE